MTTPSGTITMANVNTELGRTSTSSVNMNDAAVRALARVPTANSAISMDNLRNKKFINFPGFSISAFGNPSPGEIASASFNIYPNYTVLGSSNNYVGIENSVFSVIGQWIPTDVSSVVDDYQIRVTQTSGGTVTGDALNTWLNAINSPYEWIVEATYPASNSATLQVDFRNTATTTIVETGSVILQASF